MPTSLSPFITPVQPQTNSARAKRDILRDYDAANPCATQLINAPDNIHQLVGIVEIAVGEANYRKIDLNDPVVIEGLRGLCASIMVNGLVQPIVVRAKDPVSQTHEVIAGHRRFLACQMSQQLAKDPDFQATYFNDTTLSLCQPIEQVDVFIRFGQAVDQERAVMFIENIQRENPSIIEEALGLKEVMAMTQKNQSEIARVIGKNPVYVSEVLKVLNVAEPILIFINDKNHYCRDRKTIAELDRAYQLAPQKVTQLMADYKTNPGIELRREATRIKSQAQFDQREANEVKTKTHSRAAPVLGFQLIETKSKPKLTIFKRGRQNDLELMVTKDQLVDLRDQIESLLE